MRLAVTFAGDTYGVGLGVGLAVGVEVGVDFGVLVDAYQTIEVSKIAKTIRDIAVIFSIDYATHVFNRSHPIKGYS